MSSKAYAKMNHEQKQKMFRQQTKRRARPDKKARTVTVSFRLTPFIIGRALDGLKGYDKNFEPANISKIVKDVFYHGLNNLTTHFEDGKVSNETKLDLTELSSQIHIDDMEKLTTRSNPIRNSNPNNCSINLFEQQAKAALDDRKYSAIEQDKIINTDSEKQQQMEEQTARENAEFIKRLKAGEIE